jgi:hypothetical protein
MTPGLRISLSTVSSAAVHALSASASVATLAVTAKRSGRFEASLLRVSISVFTILTFLFLV